MKNLRVGSIDVFRAITMYFMVFVNSLWTVQGVPEWLEHAPGKADGMGFSDVIFPAFLFIVGLSVPFAQESRLAKGESRASIFQHTLLRSLALIIMGFFQVNMENYASVSLLPKSVWIIGATLAFFMVWLDYKNERLKKWKSVLQVLGLVLLLMMALLYKGVSKNEDIVWMRPQWWGILGLIGWAYLVCASITLFCGRKISVAAFALIIFLGINVAHHSGWLNGVSSVTQYGIFDIGNASNSFLVMCGIFISLLYFNKNASFKSLMMWLLSIAVVLLLFGFITRPIWGISKIRATPSWITICAAISIIFFLILIFIVDKKGKQNWFAFIKPAGTSTLTCYLLPYFYDAIFIMILDIRLPLFLRTGMVGIIKCLLFALLIVLITGWLEKRKIRLRI